jgi:hypothetical protein
MTFPKLFSFLLLLSTLFLTFSPVIQSYAAPSLLVELLPTAPNQEAGVFFYAKLTCDKTTGCQSTDIIKFAITPRNKDGLFTVTTRQITTLEYTWFTEEGNSIIIDQVSNFIQPSPNTITTSFHLPSDEYITTPGAVLYIVGKINILFSAKGDLETLFSHQLKLIISSHLSDEKTPPSSESATNFVWYDSLVIPTSPELLFTPQPKGIEGRNDKNENNDKEHDSKDGNEIAQRDENPNWDFTIKLPRVPIDPYYFEITFFGGNYGFTRPARCSVNGNPRVLTTSQMTSKISAISTYNNIKISTPLPGLPSFDSKIDMYISCSDLNFFYPQNIIESNNNFGFVSVIVHHNTTETRPIATTFLLDFLTQYRLLDHFNPKTLLSLYPISGDFSPITPTLNKAQLAYKMLINLGYRFTPLDRRYKLGIPAGGKEEDDKNQNKNRTQNQEENLILPSELFSHNTWSSHLFELEVTWATQERIMVDATWVLQQMIEYTLPKTVNYDRKEHQQNNEQTPTDEFDIVHQYHVVNSAPILVNSFHQQVSWISSPFSISPKNDNFANVSILPEYVTHQEATLRIQIQAFHDDIPSFDDEQTPTVVVHMYHVDDFGEKIYLKSLNSSSSPPAGRNIRKLSPTLYSHNDSRLIEQQLNAPHRWVNQSIAISHLYRAEWPINIIPVANPDQDLPPISDLNMLPVYKINPKTQKIIKNGIIGYGFEVTFTTPLSQLYPKIHSGEQFRPNTIVLDMNSNSQYRFQTPSMFSRQIVTDTETTEPDIICYWNNVKIPSDSLSDIDNKPIPVSTLQFNTTYPTLQPHYRQLTIHLPENDPITSPIRQYHLKCTGPLIVLASTNSRGYVTDREHVFIRFKTFYKDYISRQDQIPIRQIDDFYSTIQFSTDIPFNFNERPVDEVFGRGMIVLFISIPTAILLASLLVWNRHRQNQKHKLNHLHGESNAVGSISNSSFSINKRNSRTSTKVNTNNNRNINPESFNTENHPHHIDLPGEYHRLE